jgi:hypothetical protein
MPTKPKRVAGKSAASVEHVLILKDQDMLWRRPSACGVAKGSPSLRVRVGEQGSTLPLGVS